MKINKNKKDIKKAHLKKWAFHPINFVFLQEFYF
jgi:hypothetical protein